MIMIGEKKKIEHQSWVDFSVYIVNCVVFIILSVVVVGFLISVMKENKEKM
jgi:hypothetical protein